MRIFYLILLCVFALPGSHLFGQCPPTGFPDPGNTCPTAPILCENLDGYCATINNNNTSQPFPGCSGQYVLNNDEWFAFFAGTTSITIQVTPSNCSQNGNNEGLQGGISGACMTQVMDVQCQCTENPFILQSNNFVVGQEVRHELPDRDRLEAEQRRRGPRQLSVYSAATRSASTSSSPARRRIGFPSSR